MVVPGAALLMSTRQDVPKQAHATAWRRCEPGRPATVDEEMQGLLSRGAPGNPQHCTDRRIGSLNAPNPRLRAQAAPADGPQLPARALNCRPRAGCGGLGTITAGRGRGLDAAPQQIMRASTKRPGGAFFHFLT